MEKNKIKGLSPLVPAYKHAAMHVCNTIHVAMWCDNLYNGLMQHELSYYMHAHHIWLAILHAACRVIASLRAM